MLRIDIINDATGTSDIGNYKYNVLVTTASSQIEHIATGVIRGHKRNNPWWKLAMLVGYDAQCKYEKELAAALDVVND